MFSFYRISDNSKLSWDKKLIKENLDNTLELLNNYEKCYPDIKTAYDCILYPTENGWQAVIDITEKVRGNKIQVFKTFPKVYKLII